MQQLCWPIFGWIMGVGLLLIHDRVVWCLCRVLCHGAVWWAAISVTVRFTTCLIMHLCNVAHSAGIMLALTWFWLWLGNCWLSEWAFQNLAINLILLCVLQCLHYTWFISKMHKTISALFLSSFLGNVLLMLLPAHGSPGKLGWLQLVMEASFAFRINERKTCESLRINPIPLAG